MLVLSQLPFLGEYTRKEMSLRLLLTRPSAKLFHKKILHQNPLTKENPGAESKG